MVKLVKNDIEMGDNYTCPFCFSRDGLIYVQSHYQCISCKQVTDPCCGGEVCHIDERLKVSENNDKGIGGYNSMIHIDNSKLTSNKDDGIQASDSSIEGNMVVNT